MLFRSRAVVLLVGSAAILVALYVDPNIFSKVLSAWSLMAASFGPLLLLTLWRGAVPPGATLVTMVAGLVLALVGIHVLSPSPGGFAERVPPLVGAVAVAGIALYIGDRRRSGS